MKVHLCGFSKDACDPCVWFDCPKRLYVNDVKFLGGWGMIVALERNGWTQGFNPIRRRWTRVWLPVVVIPPRGMALRPMKNPWRSSNGHH